MATAKTRHVQLLAGLDERSDTDAPCRRQFGHRCFPHCAVKLLPCDVFFSFAHGQQENRSLLHCKLDVSVIRSSQRNYQRNYQWRLEKLIAKEKESGEPDSYPTPLTLPSASLQREMTVWWLVWLVPLPSF